MLGGGAVTALAGELLCRDPEDFASFSSQSTQANRLTVTFTRDRHWVTITDVAPIRVSEPDGEYPNPADRRTARCTDIENLHDLRISLGPGNDTLVTRGVPVPGVTVSYYDGPGNDTLNAVISSSKFPGMDSRWWNGPGNDTYRGGPGPDTVRPGAGNDHIYGAGGNDVLYGGIGNDLIFGGPGLDRMFGGPGLDRMFGGPGLDRIDGLVRNFRRS